MIGVVSDEADKAETRMQRVALRVPLSREMLVDLALLVVFAGTYLLALLLLAGQSYVAWWPALVSTLATSTLLARRYLPWAGLVVLLGVTIAFTWMRLPIGALNLAILVSVYSVCLRTELLGAVGAALLAMVWPVSKLWLISLSPHEEVLMIVGALVNLVMVVGWGRSMRVKRNHAGQLEQTVSLLNEARDQLAAEAATVERSRIAREFHDIVSHNLSVVALRAGVARSLVDRNPDHARETLRELEQTSRASLEEMRHLLNALREGPEPGTSNGPPPGEQEQQERKPTPGLHQVDTLIDSVRGMGVVWSLERRGVARELGTSVEMTAYRIVQEAVTNVLKHASSGYARVLIEYQAANVRIEVSNHATDPDAAAVAVKPQTKPVTESAGVVSGHGLIGLRERVSLFGGVLTAHPVSNGFHLSAVLPCPEISDLI